MKKLLAILLAAVMLLVFASCGGNGGNEDNTEKNDEKINAEDVINKELEEAEEHDSFSRGAVEYYLKKTAGIKLDELEPDWEWKLKSDYSAYADDPASGTGHAVITFTKAEGEVTEDEFDAWYKKVFVATAKASDDGYNIRGYEFAGDGEDALGEVTLDEALDSWLMKGWGFRVDGKNYVVYVSDEYDNNKDSELGKLFYYDGAKVDIGVGLQKSFSDTMDEAEKYMSENEDEIRDAIKDYLG
ncbi:MAG: hypothetical protein IKK09_02130 [Clostridia bacterium]|nr:hypothetical protein [Clostridia bacterium]